MNRTLNVERLYFLGQYQNIKFSNVLTDIPEHLAKDERIVSLLFFQNTLSCELAYRMYISVIETLVKEKKDPIPFIEEVREQTFAKLLEEISKADNEKILNDYGKKGE